MQVRNMNNRTSDVTYMNERSTEMLFVDDKITLMQCLPRKVIEHKIKRKREASPNAVTDRDTLFL